MPFDPVPQPNDSDGALLGKTLGLIRGGWVKGSGQIGEARCLANALWKVVTDTYSGHDFTLAAESGEARATFVRLARRLGFKDGSPKTASDRIILWNDQEDRTHADVIALLEAGIANVPASPVAA